tara:strand:- start:205 stop:948 length:744 start_codon:yes stop_codon:yes gene_type:complete
MEKNKTGKYLKYAIGEIVLVMIGILLAISINNWNEHKKNVQQSKTYLNGIIKDIAVDTLYLTSAIDDIKKALITQESLIQKVKYTSEDLNNLRYIFSPDYWDFYITDQTFKQIQNSSKARLIGFDSIYNKISNYYTVIKQRIDKNTLYEIKEATKETDLIKIINSNIEMGDYYFGETNLLERELEISLVNSQEENDQAFLKLVNSIEARNYIKRTYLRYSHILRGYTNCNQNAKDIIITINKTLKED